MSGFGFELTFRLKHSHAEAATIAAADRKFKTKGDNYLVDYVPKWPINMLNNLARYVFNTHRTFDVGTLELNGNDFKQPRLIIIA